MNKPTAYKMFSALSVAAYGAIIATDMWLNKHRMYTHTKTFEGSPVVMDINNLLAKKGDKAIDRISGRDVVVEGFKGKYILVAGRDGGPIYMRPIGHLQKDFTV